MASSSSSSSSLVATQQKYDVFLSFRGVDTRESFTSHLYAALRRENIQTFVDYRLERGDEISEALLNAIKESRLSLVILSENYATSSWCLDELVQILNCKERYGQVVIPIFYGIDPSHVRKQKGAYATAFARLERRFKYSVVQDWRDALTNVANLSGWDSTKTRPESELVEAIVKDVLMKLNNKLSSEPRGLVGTRKRIKKIESLLHVGSSDVRILGIWGMGGIGKTTLASIIFRRLSSQFKSRCFLANIREALGRCGVDHLQNTLLAELLEEENINMMPTISFMRSNFFKAKLRFRKVLIVLDDVDNLNQLELLIGERQMFGSGSRIIVTTRNVQVLRNIGADKKYNVEALDVGESLHLFSLNAFKRKSPPTDYDELAKRVVNYAKGNPLALRILGSFLYHRSEKEWQSALSKLKKIPDMELWKVLKISYDGLDDEEKEIFLDVACFFNGQCRDDVERILEGFGFSSAIGIRVLVDKSLITIESNKLQMHDLIQEMGREIVRQQSSKEPGNRSRVWKVKDACHLLEKDTIDTIAVEGISLDLSQIKELHIHPTTFSRMSHLRFLKIYQCICGHVKNGKKIFDVPEDLQFLPDSLRCLLWDGYPLKSLPSNIAENLVELDMHHSKLERLWNGVQRFENLKRINLRHSHYLTQIPDLCGAPNIVSINLECCTRLVGVTSYDFERLDKLTSLNLGFCENHNFSTLEISNPYDCLNLKDLPKMSGDISHLKLHGTRVEEFPSLIGSQTLEKSCVELQLRNIEDHHTDDPLASKPLNNFPKLPRNIKELHLSDIRIKQVPSSIQYLSTLKALHLRNCEKLESLPTTICRLQFLEKLSLFGCSRFENFPEILEPMKRLWFLSLGKTSIKGLPSSIENLIELQELRLPRCDHFELVSNTCRLNRLISLNLSGCLKLARLPPMSITFCNLKKLYLSDCNIQEISEDLSSLSSIKHLDLRGNNFEVVPTSIRHLSKLVVLDICNCRWLKSLPELPPSLERLFAHNCVLLEMVSSSKGVIFDGWDQHHTFHSERFFFTNCLKLDLNAYNNILADAQLRIWKAAIELREKDHNSVLICCPGGEIPEWFSYKAEGCSIKMKLSSGWFNMDFLGFALCGVLAAEDCDRLCFDIQVCLKHSGGKDFDFNHSLYHSRKEINKKNQQPGSLKNMDRESTELLASDHILLCYNKCLNLQVKEKGKDWCCNVTDASFKIATSHGPSDKKCLKQLGICLLYAKDLDNGVRDKSQGKKQLKVRDQIDELGHVADGVVIRSCEEKGKEESRRHNNTSKRVKFA